MRLDKIEPLLCFAFGLDTECKLPVLISFGDEAISEEKQFLTMIEIGRLSEWDEIVEIKLQNEEPSERRWRERTF